MIREWRTEDKDRVAVFMNMFMQASKEVKLDTNYTHNRYLTLVEAGICKIYLAEEGNTIQGVIGFMVAPDLHENKLVAIEAFWFVDPTYRGIGKLLFNTFEEEAKKLGCTKFAMIHMVDSYPESLKVFYEKSGYHLTELHYVKEV